MKVLDLFSGIGGFSLGLERAGMETVAFCEIEKFPQKVLKKHWPEVPIYEDVRTLTAERLARDGVGRIDLICGGFPCQDISTAGKGAGIEGERSGLWSEIARLIGELRPRYAIMENVSALLGRGLDKVLGDLAEIGYDAEWHCIPASELGAHHHRDRVWIIAYPASYGGCGTSNETGQKTRRQDRKQAEQLAVDGSFQPMANTLGEQNDKIGEADECRRDSLGRDNQTAQRENGATGNDSIGRRSRTPETMANPDSQGMEGRQEAGDPGEGGEGLFKQLIRCLDSYEWEDWAVEPDVGQLVDGLSLKLDRLRRLTDDQRWVQISCQKTAEECLRDLRKYKNTLRPSHRQGLDEHRPIKLADALQFVSYLATPQSVGHSDEEGVTEVTALRENILSSKLVQHSSDTAEKVWESLADQEADWFILATCLGRTWDSYPVGRVGNKIPDRTHRLKALGNAVVPQIPELIGKAIMGIKQCP
jgi:DNA-cytosine methyltransferase